MAPKKKTNTIDSDEELEDFQPKPKSNFAMLMGDESGQSDSDNDSDTEEATEAPPPKKDPPKKEAPQKPETKKGKQKKKNGDDEELEKMLAEINLENK
ncbi:hypothetical protein QYM36_005067, partial [Artemia franciscana]